MIRRTFFILILALGATSVYAISRPELDSLYSNFHLEEVEVTARALTKDVIVPQTLKGAQLERLNALNVADALRYFSGVQLKDYGGVGGIKTINVRSMGSQHTAVYYNGVQLGNAQNGQVDLGRFSLDNMEQIQLYNGQKSDIFQSTSLSITVECAWQPLSSGRVSKALRQFSSCNESTDSVTSTSSVCRRGF